MTAPPRRSGRARQIALALPAFVLACTVGSALAALNDNTVKGAATNHIFSSGFGDSIDALSGQLYFNLPIGPTYEDSPQFSYQVNLAYTSKVWRYHPRLNVPRYEIDGRGQAGVGFYLQMGRIFWKWSEPGCNDAAVGYDTRKLILQLGDGTECDPSRNPDH